MTLLQPTFFSPIIQYIATLQASELMFEIEDNFQKQTYRNRCYINTSNGKQLINVPVQHSKNIKIKTKDVKIDYKDDWHKHFLKTLKTAYNSSPFFEFYIDDLLPIINKKYNFLLDLNFSCHNFVMEALQLDIPFSKSMEYEKEFDGNDFRNLANVSKDPLKLDKYTQVFDTNGFISNLSILDLIFMEGPSAENYLIKQTLQI
ncbi:WbqC family protein [Lutibacter maritimus]|uniref:WbqC-like protein family protein n=1 Tax=Lutibacter maritimus TaxID=593133 RepID=A0A1I6S087_9FLAO|nr:WbqC family protein [Lutibacter maritimus]SFS70326.1 WbqC-like protein family protein [Lutibacter maritimus]